MLLMMKACMHVMQIELDSWATHHFWGALRRNTDDHIRLYTAMYTMPNEENEPALSKSESTSRHRQERSDQGGLEAQPLQLHGVQGTAES